jgi:hypothetical protein
MAKQSAPTRERLKTRARTQYAKRTTTGQFKEMDEVPLPEGGLTEEREDHYEAVARRSSRTGGAPGDDLAAWTGPIPDDASARRVFCNCPNGHT